MTKMTPFITLLILLAIAPCTFAQPPGQGMPVDEDSMIERYVDQMATQLGLSEDQQTQIVAILKEEHDQHAAVRKEAQDKVSAVLTETQRQKVEEQRRRIEEMRARQMEQFHNMGGVVQPE